jgi:sugar-specific transcriptional regulator TrmB
MLEAPEKWLSVKDIATSVEGRESTETDRNAVYEILRRMAVQGEVERDSSSRPTLFRAKAAVLRERLLNDAS